VPGRRLLRVELAAGAGRAVNEQIAVAVDVGAPAFRPVEPGPVALEALLALEGLDEEWLFHPKSIVRPGAGPNRTFGEVFDDDSGPIPWYRVDDQELLSLSTADFGAETRRLALEAYEQRDWQMVHGWTKAWISNGGDAWVIDSWLLYVVSDLLHGQPKSAVNATDLALGNWVEAPEDRAVLLWVRAFIIQHRLRDPTQDAEASRKRKRSVGPAPPFVTSDRDFVAGPVSVPEPGSVPSVWNELLQTLRPEEQ